MANQKQKKNKNLLLLGVAILIVIILFLALNKKNYFPTSQDTYDSMQNSPQFYKSKNMELSFKTQDKFNVEEHLTYIDLVEKNTNKKINISRNGTNLDDIQSYLQDFDLKRTIKITKEDSLKIDGYDSIARIQVFQGGPVTENKVYYIYVEGEVYSFSTSFPDLYNDLDQIAQSFRYEP